MRKPYLIVIALLAVFGVAGFAMGYYGEAPKVVVEGNYIEAQNSTEMGAMPSPDVYERMTFHQGFNTGGEYFATTSAIATYTIPPSELDDEAYWIQWTPNLNTTLTLPATTTAGFDNIVGKDAGATRTVYVYNASSTVAATMTFAAGAGIDLQEDEGETVIVNGLEIARLTFLRKANSDVIAWLEVGQLGD
jgi:hypothetical protein